MREETTRFNYRLDELNFQSMGSYPIQVNHYVMQNLKYIVKQKLVCFGNSLKKWMTIYFETVFKMDTVKFSVIQEPVSVAIVRETKFHGFNAKCKLLQHLCDDFNKKRVQTKCRHISFPLPHQEEPLVIQNRLSGVTVVFTCFCDLRV